MNARLFSACKKLNYITKRGAHKAPSSERGGRGGEDKQRQTKVAILEFLKTNPFPPSQVG
jgi:hypothetical protein